MVCDFSANPELNNIITIVKSKNNAYEKQQSKTDLNFKLAIYMRNRLYLLRLQISKGY